MVTLREILHHHPMIKENVLHFRLGISIDLDARASLMIKFSFEINQTVEFKDIGKLRRGV